MSILQIEKREKGKPAQLRRRGLLPVALVERSHTTSLYQTSELDLKKAMAAADGLGRVDVEIAGQSKKVKAIVKHIEKNFVHQEILTVTLQEVSEDDVVRIELPIVPINVPADIDGQDVNLLQQTDFIKVRGKMSAMPEQIEIDCANMAVGDHVSAGDLKLPEGIELQSSPDATLVSLQFVKEVSLEPETAEEPAEGEEAEAPQE